MDCVVASYPQNIEINSIDRHRSHRHHMYYAIHTTSSLRPIRARKPKYHFLSCISNSPRPFMHSPLNTVSSIQYRFMVFNNASAQRPTDRPTNHQRTTDDERRHRRIPECVPYILCTLIIRLPLTALIIHVRWPFVEETANDDDDALKVRFVVLWCCSHILTKMISSAWTPAII